jgi:hypothetical protein
MSTRDVSPPDGRHPDLPALHRYAAGALGAADDALADHVESCPDCAAEVERIRHMTATLALASEPPADLYERALAVRRAEQGKAAPRGGVRPLRSWRWAAVPAGLAAAALLGIFGTRLRSVVERPTGAATSTTDPEAGPQPGTPRPPAPDSPRATTPATRPGASPAPGPARPGASPASPTDAPPDRPSGRLRSAGVGDTSTRPLAYDDVLVPIARGTALVAEPARDARPLATVGPADELLFRGEERDGYVKVRFGSTDGWIRRDAVVRP